MDWFDTFGGFEITFSDRYALALTFLLLVASVTIALHLAFINSVIFGPSKYIHPINLIDFFWYLGGAFLVAVALHEFHISQMENQYQMDLREEERILEFLNLPRNVERMRESCENLAKISLTEEDHNFQSRPCGATLKGVEPVRLNKHCGDIGKHFSMSDNHSFFPQTDSRPKNASRSLNYVRTICGYNHLLDKTGDRILERGDIIDLSKSEFGVDQFVSLNFLFSLLIGLKLLKTSCGVFPKALKLPEPDNTNFTRFF
ncbi:MAG: hypothetical protein QNJ16_11035 [Rhodobacter sp.]|nr:hypothetical protein [Rhodobacter sp.]